jgi:hypothetical protein
VAHSTLEQQSAQAPEDPPQPDKRRATDLLRKPTVLLIAIAVLALATVIVLWARTRPGYDPYGWLVWGRQTIKGALDTNAAPSWKPLPYLFTFPYALFGHYQLWLWMITSVAISLSGVVFAARIAYRVTDAPPERRYAAYAAGAFAGLALLGITDYAHYVLSAQSDPLIASLCLGAIDCHLSRRPRWAFALLVLASLGRPEVWPFIAGYAIWAWLRVPAMRWMVVAGAIVVLALWFGIPGLTSNSFFQAGSHALGSGRAIHGNKVTGIISRFVGLHSTGLELLALLSVVLATVRRDRTTLALAAAAVAWVIVEIAFALHGWPGVPRYMFPAAAVMVVIAAIAVGRLLAEPPRLSSAAGLVGLAVVIVAVASLVPPAISDARTAHKDLVAQRLRTKEINQLTGSIRRLGGAARMRACGEPLTRLEYQSILAWQLNVNVATVGFKYGPAIADTARPIVLFSPLPNGGWKITALHQTSPECRSLPH